MAPRQTHLPRLHLKHLRSQEESDGSLTITGTAVPYGEVITYMGLSESFSPGAFSPDNVTGSPLLWSHLRDEQLGHITEARNRDDGLEVTAKVLPTSRGQDIITLIRAGSLQGMSVGFEPVEWVTEKDGSLTYTRADLLELSLTPLPAYEQAAISEARSQEGSTVEPAAAVQEIPAHVAEVLTRVDQLEARMLTQKQEPGRVLTVHEAFLRQLLGSREGVTPGQKPTLRALADTVSAGNSGILPPEWSREIRDTLDSTRYMIPRLGRMAFPANGYTLTVPKVLTHVVIAPRGAEKSAIPSGPFSTGQDTYTATWYAGGVDIAMELVNKSDPAVLGLCIDSLFRQYAAITDLAVTGAVAGAGTPVGSVLDFTSYGAFIADIVTTGDAIRVATGSFGDLLSLTTASWIKLLGLMDATDRRVLATSGPQNADGSANLTAGQVNLGGITIWHNPRAAEDVQFNTVAARVAEYPPQQLQAVNVELAGYDVGVLGAVMDLPLYPAGIKVHSVTARAAAEKRK